MHLVIDKFENVRYYSTHIFYQVSIVLPKEKEVLNNLIVVSHI